MHVAFQLQRVGSAYKDLDFFEVKELFFSVSHQEIVALVCCFTTTSWQQVCLSRRCLPSFSKLNLFKNGRLFGNVFIFKTLVA